MQHQRNTAVDTAQQANDFFNENKTKNNNNNNSNINSNINNLTNTNTNTSSSNLALLSDHAKPSSAPSQNTLSPILIAVIIIIPVLAAVVSILYFRKSIFNRSNTLPHQINLSNSSPIIPPGGTGADRPIGQRRTDRFRRRIIGALHRSSSRSESIRTVPEYSADPQETEISLAHAQRSGAASESNLITRFITQTHLTHPTSRNHPHNPPPTTAGLFPMETSHPLNPNHHSHHYTQEPPPGYEASTSLNPRHSPTPNGSTSNLPNPIQVVIPLPNQPSNDQLRDHQQNLQLQRSLTSTSDASSFITTPPNTKPNHDPNTPRLPSLMHTDFSGLFRGSSQSTLIPLPSMTTTTTTTTSSSSPSAQPPSEQQQQTDDYSRTNNSIPTSSDQETTQDTTTHASSTTNQQVYYNRIPSGGPTPQQLSFLTRIGNLSRLGLPRPPQLFHDPPPIHHDDQFPPPTPPPPFDPSPPNNSFNSFPPPSNSR